MNVGSGGTTFEESPSYHFSILQNNADLFFLLGLSNGDHTLWKYMGSSVGTTAIITKISCDEQVIYIFASVRTWLLFVCTIVLIR